MKKFIKNVLSEEKIEYFGIIPFSKCRVINNDLLKRFADGWEVKSVIMLIVPYYTGEYENRNISLYAVSKDYHLYFKGLFERVIGKLSGITGYNFCGFADHSPISETYAASMAGLGVIGDKFQLINKEYGSHVFIGEILTDMIFDNYDISEIKFCNHCGLCSEACPSVNECLSGITQKKGELNKYEEEQIIKNGSVWGCDLCREVCPMNKNTTKTPIQFFYDNRIPFITSDIIENMSKEDFNGRAYGWRGKQTVLRNLKLHNV